MQKFTTPRAGSAVLLTCLLGLTACDAPEFVDVPAEPRLASLEAPTLLECPVPPGRATQALILPLVGGSVTLEGNGVTVPGEALVDTTAIGIEVPASPHVRVELSADGQEHWQFQAPVSVTIDYSRCSPSAYGGKTLSVWLIDPETGALLEPMGGVDNRSARQITFETDHFSGYAIAN